MLIGYIDNATTVRKPKKEKEIFPFLLLMHVCFCLRRTDLHVQCLCLIALVVGGVNQP